VFAYTGFWNCFARSTSMENRLELFHADSPSSRTTSPSGNEDKKRPIQSGGTCQRHQATMVRLRFRRIQRGIPKSPKNGEKMRTPFLARRPSPLHRPGRGERTGGIIRISPVLTEGSFWELVGDLCSICERLCTCCQKMPLRCSPSVPGCSSTGFFKGKWALTVRYGE
jgi:hypothetical protein